MLNEVYTYDRDTMIVLSEDESVVLKRLYVLEDDMLFANLLSDGVAEEEKEEPPVFSYDINWIKELAGIIQGHYRETAKKNNVRF